MKLFNLLVCVILLVYLVIIEGRGVWTKKRPKSDDDEGSVEEVQISKLNLNKRQRITSENGDLQKISSFLNMAAEYLDKMSDFIDTPQFAETVTAEQLKTVFSSYLGSTNNEFLDMFDSEQFKNPENLRETMKTGLETLKQYFETFKDVLTDPVKLQEAIDAIPDEYRALVEQLLNGDTTGLQNILQNLPNGEYLSALLSGNTDSVINSVKNVLQDRDQLESVRQQLIENPELAASFGIGPEIFGDRERWESLMREGVEAMEGRAKESKRSNAFGREREL